MATPGKLHHLTMSEISEALIKNNGQVIKSAHSLGIHHDTLYEYFKKHPEMWELVNDLRKNYNRYEKTLKIESSKAVINRLLQKVDTHPSIALRAAMYNLDNLGQEEGYGKKNDSTENENIDILRIKTIIEKENNIIREE
jgi:hypothetical protein